MLFLASAFVFGVIVGSFLNVVIFRLGSGRDLSGRSECLSCGARLLPIDLVPILSYVALRGRCRRCGSRISVQYPLIELTTGLLFAAIASLPIAASEMVLLMTLFAFLVAIAVYDLRHKIIPDVLVYFFDAVALGAASFISYQHHSWPMFFGFVLSGVAMAVPLYLLWRLSRGRAMGLGDAKLALGIGLMLGPAPALSAFIFSFWSGALVGVVLMVVQRFSLHGRATALTMKSEIPFAPFLILGALLVKLLGIEIPAIETFFHAL